MTKKILPSILCLLAFIFGIYSCYRMIFKNRAPYVLTCEGLVLSPSMVYIFDNSNKHFGSDTIQITFENAFALMPKRLGVLRFDKNWLFQPAVQIGSAESVTQPTCRSIEEDFFGNGTYYSANERVAYGNLLSGVKINTKGGDKNSRVLIKLRKRGNEVILKTATEGILSQYLIESGQVNEIGVFFNVRPNAKFKHNFKFEKTFPTNNSVSYKVQILANTFRASVDVFKNDQSIFKEKSQNNLEFKIENVMFSLEPKLSLFDITTLLITVILCFFFQIWLLYNLFNKTLISPILINLITIRLFLNSIYFLAIPTYILALSATGSRWVYLLAVVVLNFTMFINKNSFHFLVRLKINKKFALLSLIFSCICLPTFKLLTQNESFLGIIPTLHVLKYILLAFILPVLFFTEGWKRENNYKKFVLIFTFAFVASLLSSDFGSIIYTTISILFIALIGKDSKITPRNLMLTFSGLVILLSLLYFLNPENFIKDKIYRLYAPYTHPDDEALINAKQADREFYAMLDLNLKNQFELISSPRFENISIPPNAKSTAFSDYAFHWTFSVCGKVWGVLFIVVVLSLFRNLLFFLYCSIREIKIKENVFFIFSISVGAQLTRFLIAFACVSIIYPVVSNLCMSPLTGQSIVMLSTSFWEIVFFTIFIVIIESVFTNEKYYFTKPSGYQYYGTGLQKDVNLAMICFVVLFILGFVVKLIHLSSLQERLEWTISKKSNPDFNLPKTIDSLRVFIDNQYKNKKLEPEDKVIIREATSRIYTGKSYGAHVYLPKKFALSAENLSSQMNIDSIFTYKRKRINGPNEPFGDVFAFEQKVNSKSVYNTTHPLYKCLPYNSTTVNADLTAELNLALQQHISLLKPGNIGGVMITDRFGNVISNSTSPYDSDLNSNDKDYLIGSIKKILLAYCALAVNPAYKNKVWAGRTFENLIVNSDSYYAGELLRDILVNHKNNFEKVLREEFSLALVSTTESAFMTEWPSKSSLEQELIPNGKNNNESVIYRYAIGQQKPYPFSMVMGWMTKIAFNMQNKLTYNQKKQGERKLSINETDLAFLHESMAKVVTTTAQNVGTALKVLQIEGQFKAKTGTAQKADGVNNQSSSLIIFNSEYCVGVYLNGDVPENSQKLGAKHLFEKLIPLLLKYEILHK